MYVYTLGYVYIHAGVCVYTHWGMYIYPLGYVYIRTGVCIYTCWSMYIYTLGYVYIHTGVCIYTHWGHMTLHDGDTDGNQYLLLLRNVIVFKVRRSPSVFFDVYCAGVHLVSHLVDK